MIEQNESKKERPYAFENLEPTKLARMAGLLQGEAEFTSDKRTRSKSGDPNYTPPPAIPKIKLEMVEKDLMEHFGQLVDENVVLVKRKTTANKQVYKVTMQAREKTEIFLRLILPFIVGEKNRSRIIELLKVCDTYNQWVADGGRTKVAQLAARSKKKKPTKNSE